MVDPQPANEHGQCTGNDFLSLVSSISLGVPTNKAEAALEEERVSDIGPRDIAKEMCQEFIETCNTSI